jgi:ADP-ribosylglycohydrolase
LLQRYNSVKNKGEELPMTITSLENARISLEGLSVGDTFGETFFGETERVTASIANRTLKSPPWRYTDDTEMALSIFSVLREHGYINQDALVRIL